MLNSLAAAALERAQTLPRRTIVLAVVLCAGGVPLLPTNDLKIIGTVLAGLVLAAGVSASGREGLGPRSALDAPALAFLLAASLATVFSVNPLVSFLPTPIRGEGLLDYFVYIPMALAAARLSRPEADEVLTVLLVAAAAIGAIGVAQYYGLDVTPWFGNNGLSFGRSWSTLSNPEFLGGYASLVLPIGLAFALLEPGRRWLGYAGASTLVYAAMLGSQTRSAWGGTALALVVLLRLLPRSPQTYRRAAILGCALAAVTAVMVLTRPQVSFEGRATSALNPADSSMQGRLFIWTHTLPLIAQRPLLGWGFTALLGRLPGVGTPEYVRVFGREPLLIDTVHNDILQVAFTTGLAGLAAYAWVWTAALLALRSAVRTPGAPAASPALFTAAPAGLLGGLLAYLVWLQLAWSHIGNANLFWVLAGIAAGLGRAARHPHAPESVSAPLGLGLRREPERARGPEPRRPSAIMAEVTTRPVVETVRESTDAGLHLSRA